MRFNAVHVYSSKDYPERSPLVFYRDPEALYIWFSKTDAFILAHLGWKEWKPGTSIADTLNG